MIRFLLLLCLAMPAFATPISITDAGCPSQSIDIVSGQLVCVPVVVPPPPPPPPVGAACPVAPNLFNSGVVITGGPFTNCGETTNLRSPNPTAAYWHITGSSGRGFSQCIQPGSWAQEQWRYQNGTVIVNSGDTRIILNDTVTGNLVLNSSRVKINTINGKFVSGDVICGPNAHNVEFNGECVCP